MAFWGTWCKCTSVLSVQFIPWINKLYSDSDPRTNRGLQTDQQPVWKKKFINMTKNNKKKGSVMSVWFHFNGDGKEVQTSVFGAWLECITVFICTLVGFRTQLFLNGVAPDSVTHRHYYCQCRGQFCTLKESPSGQQPYAGKYHSAKHHIPDTSIKNSRRAEWITLSSAGNQN